MLNAIKRAASVMLALTVLMSSMSAVVYPAYALDEELFMEQQEENLEQQQEENLEQQQEENLEQQQEENLEQEQEENFEQQQEENLEQEQEENLEQQQEENLEQEQEENFEGVLDLKSFPRLLGAGPMMLMGPLGISPQSESDKTLDDLLSLMGTEEFATSKSSGDVQGVIRRVGEYTLELRRENGRTYQINIPADCVPGLSDSANEDNADYYLPIDENSSIDILLVNHRSKIERIFLNDVAIGNSLDTSLDTFYPTKDHVHTFAESWETTYNSHWHPCTGDVCPLLWQSDYMDQDGNPWDGLEEDAAGKHEYDENYVCKQCGKKEMLHVIGDGIREVQEVAAIMGSTHFEHYDDENPANEGELYATANGLLVFRRYDGDIPATMPLIAFDRVNIRANDKITQIKLYPLLSKTSSITLKLDGDGHVTEIEVTSLKIPVQGDSYNINGTYKPGHTKHHYKYSPDENDPTKHVGVCQGYDCPVLDTKEHNYPTKMPYECDVCGYVKQEQQDDYIRQLLSAMGTVSYMDSDTTKKVEADADALTLTMAQKSGGRLDRVYTRTVDFSEDTICNVVSATETRLIRDFFDVTFTTAGTPGQDFKVTAISVDDGRVVSLNGSDFSGEYQPAHTGAHNFSEDWAFDDESHWHDCQTPYCGIWMPDQEDVGNGYGEHSYDDLSNGAERYTCQGCGKEDSGKKAEVENEDTVKAINEFLAKAEGVTFVKRASSEDENAAQLAFDATPRATLTRYVGLLSLRVDLSKGASYQEGTHTVTITAANGVEMVFHLDGEVITSVDVSNAMGTLPTVNYAGTYGNAANHVHQFKEDYVFDDLAHWKPCIADNCPEFDITKLESYGEHTYEEDGYICTVADCGWESETRKEELKLKKIRSLLDKMNNTVLVDEKNEAVLYREGDTIQMSRREGYLNLVVDVSSGFELEEEGNTATLTKGDVELTFTMDETGALKEIQVKGTRAYIPSYVSFNKTYRNAAQHQHHFAAAWDHNDYAHWHVCDEPYCALTSYMGVEGSDYGFHRYGDVGDDRFVCQDCQFENTTLKKETEDEETRQKVREALELLEGQNFVKLDREDPTANAELVLTSAEDMTMTLTRQVGLLSLYLNFTNGTEYTENPDGSITLHRNDVYLTLFPDGEGNVTKIEVEGARSYLPVFYYDGTYYNTATHTHNFTGEWKYDGTGHWHECDAEGCLILDYSTCGEEDAAYAAHDYGPDGIPIQCVDCGYENVTGDDVEIVRQIAELLKKMDGSLMRDSNDVSVATAQNNYATLVFTGRDSQLNTPVALDKKVSLAVDGDVYTITKTNDLGQDIVIVATLENDKLVKMEVTGVYGGVPLASYAGTYGSTAGHIHSFGSEWDYDETAHWYPCTESTCPLWDYSEAPAEAAYAQHSYGTEGEAAYTCTVCGYLDEEKEAEISAELLKEVLELLKGGRFVKEDSSAEVTLSANWDSLVVKPLPSGISTVVTLTQSGVDNGRVRVTKTADGYTITKTTLLGGVQTIKIEVKNGEAASMELDRITNLTGTRNYSGKYINAGAHKHEFGTTWVWNQAAHWHPCTVDGCTEMNFSGVEGSGYAPHTYDGNVCSVCGAVKSSGGSSYGGFGGIGSIPSFTLPTLPKLPSFGSISGLGLELPEDNLNRKAMEDLLALIPADATPYLREVIEQKALELLLAGSPEELEAMFAEGEALLNQLVAEEHPAMLEGNNAVWFEDSNKDLRFRSEADFACFIRVEVDGKVVDPQNYTVSEGSTVVELKDSYLRTLEPGIHTMDIISRIHEAEIKATAEFTIMGAQGNTHTQETASGFSWWWLLVLLLAALACFLFYLYKKNRKEQK